MTLDEEIARKRARKEKTSHLTGRTKGGNYNPEGLKGAAPGSVEGGSVYETLRRAWEERQSADEPLGVREARKLLRRDYEKFLTMFLKAREQEGIAVTPQDRVTTVVTTDEKTEKVTKLIDSLIEEFERENSPAGDCRGG